MVHRISFLAILLIWGLVSFLFGEKIREVVRWPNGISTVATTDGDTLALVGNGSAVDLISISSPTQPRIVGRILLPATPEDITYQNGYAYVLKDFTGLTIYDVSTPSNPVELGTYDIGDTPSSVFVKDNYAYITYWNFGLAIVNISDPMNPKRVSSYSEAGTVRGVVVQDTIAYIALGWNGLRLLNVADPSSPQPLGYIDTYDDAWDVYVQNGYAYVADLSGIEVINVQDPQNLTAVKRLALDGWITSITGDGGSLIYVNAQTAGIVEIDISNPQDIHLSRGRNDINGWSVWKHNSLLIVAGYNEGVHILETAYADSIREVARYETADWALDVAVQDSLLFVGEDINGVYVVNLNAQPYPQITANIFSAWSSSTVAVEGNTLFADVNGNVRKFDCTNPGNIVEVGVFDNNMDLPTNHIFLGDRYGYSSAGSNGWYVFDKNGTGNLSTIAYWTAPDVSIVESFVVHDSLAFLAAGWDGLFILDISDTAHVRQIGHFTESDISVSSVYVEGQYAYIDNTNYFYIVDVSDPANPTLVSSYLTGNYIKDIEVHDKRAYIANNYNGLLVLDVSNPSNPQPIAEFRDMSTPAYGVKVVNNRIYLAGMAGGVYVLEMETSTAVSENDVVQPQKFWLMPNYPNPFNPRTTIDFRLPVNGTVELAIYGLDGRHVRTLVKRWLPAGRHTVQWDGRDDRGLPVSSGIYFYRLKSGKYSQTRRMVLIR